MSKTENSKAELLIKLSAAEKLRYYVEECDAEISGFGRIRDVSKTDGVKRFELYDVEILPQVVGGADADMKVEDIAAWLGKKIKAGHKVTDYKLWWHSHYTFGAFFSGTDDKTIEGSSDFPYLVSLVTNRAGEYEARLDVHKPVRVTLPVDVSIETYDNDRLREKIRKEIAEKITIKKYGAGETYQTKGAWEYPGYSESYAGYGAGFQGSWDKKWDKPIWKKDPIKVISADDYEGWEQHAGESDKQYFERITNADYDPDYEPNIRKKGDKKRHTPLSSGMA